MQTYWVRPTASAMSISNSNHTGTDASGSAAGETAVGMAVANLAGTEKEKLDWSGENYRRIGWVADLLRPVLEEIIDDRGSAKGPFVWSEKMDRRPNRIVWDAKLGSTLTSGQSRLNSCQNTSIPTLMPNC